MSRTSAPALLLLSAIASAASAPEGRAGPGDCAPLDEPEFRSYVLDAQSAIDRSDVDLPAAILSEIDGRLACLTFAPAPRMWADLLVARAIVAFSRGGNWEDPMAAALRIRPAIDRGVGPGHPLARWEPPPAPEGETPAPEGLRLYVDGFPSTAVPPPEGMYLVQKTDGRYWNTLLLEDRAVPRDWLEGPVEQPSRIRSSGRLGILLGGGRSEQVSSWGSDVYPSARAASVSFGAAGDLQLTFFSPFGVLAQGRLAYGSALSMDARIAAIWVWKGLTVGGGAGTASVSVFERSFQEAPIRGGFGTVERVRRLQYPHLTSVIRGSGRARWDLGLTVGASPAVIRYEVGAGLLLPPVGGGRYRLGLLLDGRRGAFVQQGPGDRSVSTAGEQILLRLDWVRGDS